jgi:hypothetical protein
VVASENYRRAFELVVSLHRLVIAGRVDDPEYGRALEELSDMHPSFTPEEVQAIKMFGTASNLAEEHLGFHKEKILLNDPRFAWANK